MADEMNVQYVGDKNIAEEISRLEREQMDILNYVEVMDKYRVMLSQMDSVARDKLEKYSSIMREVEDTINGEAIQNIPFDIWQKDVWYTQVYLKLKPGLGEIMSVLGHYAKIIKVQKIMIMKQKMLLDSMKGATSQNLIARTQHEMYSTLMEENRKSTAALMNEGRAQTNSVVKSTQELVSQLVTLLNQNKTMGTVTSDKGGMGATAQHNLTEQLVKALPAVPNLKDIEDAVIDFLEQNNRANNGSHINTVIKYVSESTKRDSKEIRMVLQQMRTATKIKMTGVGFSQTVWLKEEDADFSEEDKPDI